MHTSLITRYLQTRRQRIAKELQCGKITIWPWEVSDDDVDLEQIPRKTLWSTDLGNMLFEEEFPDKNLSGAVLIECNLDHSNLNGFVLDHAILAKCSLRFASLKMAEGRNVRLIKVDASWSVWTECKLTGSILRGSWFIGADLSGCDFSGCDLTGVKFIGVRAQGAHFGKANLTHCDFTYSKLADAVFDGAIFNGTDFSFADLGNRSIGPGVDVARANFFGVTFKGIRPADWPRRSPRMRWLRWPLFRTRFMRPLAQLIY